MKKTAFGWQAGNPDLPVTSPMACPAAFTAARLTTAATWRLLRFMLTEPATTEFLAA